MKRIFKLLLILICIAFLSSCSVGMALSGDEEKDTRILFTGAPRIEVIKRLGIPAESTKDKNGNYIDTYFLVMGNEPDAGRASANLALDFFTLGLWEIVATPMEMAGTSETSSTLLIYYDPEEKIKEFKQIGTSSEEDLINQIDSNNKQFEFLVGGNIEKN